MPIDPKTLTADWSFPTEIHIGPGRLREVPSLCREKGISRPLIVTDPGLAGLPMVARLQAMLADEALVAGLFADLQPNPNETEVAAGVQVFRDGGHDGVIAFGGGSALDAGKAIAFQSGQSRALADFEDVGDNWRRADAAAIAPVVAIPTTAGTGSEVGRAAVITQGDSGIKRIIFHPGMMPQAVVADPELCVGLPPNLTAATGMDALTHSLEAFCAPGFHPLADGVALEGLRLCAEWLPKAYADGADIAARTHMLVAASMGATAFQKGLGAVHSISHAVGALYGTHHGLTNAIVLPYVLQFNRPEIEQKFAQLGRTLGLPDPTFDSVFEWIMALRRTVGIPHGLSEIAVDSKQCDRIAQLAHADPTRAGNPRIVGVSDLKEIFVNAVEGRLQE
ncbi:MAG: iron-containing alcohol dehydrogenase [Alphaproteobacteria bacterium]|nr:iron-containing alcohol dehydrogenase [Alphaproteobacteria bacterium]